MKVYIGACEIGLGHIGRTIEVANKLREKGIECIFSTTGNALDFVKKNNFYAYETVPGYWSEKKNGEVDFLKTILRSPYLGIQYLRRISKERRQIVESKVDLVISDSLFATMKAVKKLNTPLFVITNQIRINLPRMRINFLKKFGENAITKGNIKIISLAEKILVPDLPYPYTISIENLSKIGEVEKRLKFVGLIVKECKKFDKKEIEAKYKVRHPFIFAPISGPELAKPSLINKLKEILPEYNSLLTTGNPEKNFEEKIKSLRIKSWVEERQKIMKIADIIISRAGLGTCGEIISFGKPCILIPQPNQPEQEGNAKSMERIGIAKIIEQNELSKEVLKNAIEDIFNNKEYIKKAKEIKEVSMKFNGVNNIVGEVINRLNSL